MNKKIIIAGIIAIVIVAVGAFIFLQKGDVKEADITSEKLIEKIAEAYQGLETYQQEMTIVFKSGKKEEGVIRKGVFTQSYSEIVDIVNRKRKVEISSRMEMIIYPERELTDEEQMMRRFLKIMDQELEMYWINDVLYVKMTSPHIPAEDIVSNWNKEEKPWRSFFGKWIKLLDEVEVEVLGIEKVDGVEYYKVEVNTTIEKIWDILMLKEEESRVGKLVPKYIPTMRGGGLVVEEVPKIARLNVKKWITKDTFLPIKIQIEIETTDEIMGVPVKKDITIYYSNFNEPVVIELPTKAATAE